MSASAIGGLHAPSSSGRIQSLDTYDISRLNVNAGAQFSQRLSPDGISWAQRCVSRLPARWIASAPAGPACTDRLRPVAGVVLIPLGWREKVPSLPPTPSSQKRHAIVAAARTEFFKFGYRRVTMNDIAKAASMSRPALYLVFPSKERVFSAVVLQLAQELSDQARAAMTVAIEPTEKLRAVFDAWAIRSFDLYCSSEEARELQDASLEFAREALVESVSMLEADLVRALQSVPARALPRGLSRTEIAHVLASSLPGFKRACRSASELSEMVNSMLRLTVRP